MSAPVYLLWDASRIWGLTAWRALACMGLPYRLIKSASIAQGALSGKPPSLLLAPGGSARLKSDALGEEGRAAVCAYVAGGGRYLGFCGGAGFALSEREGLGLCPWKRASYTNRLQHLISGHIQVQASGGSNLSPPDAAALPLPVWWPGRFAPQAGGDVEVLASYLRPASDIWLADLPLAGLPPDTLADWEDMYGVCFRPEELNGQPCIVHAAFGRGAAVLSYSHLETPDSPAANSWLAHMLRDLTGLSPADSDCPPWDIAGHPRQWDDPALRRAREALDEVIGIGLTHGLLFDRTPWLLGRRAGIPGAALNNMLAALHTVQSLVPNDDALAWWENSKALFSRKMELFRKGAEHYLLAERLASTLVSALPGAVDRRVLNMQREALFGQAMEGGGLYEELAVMLDEMIFLICRDGSVRRRHIEIPAAGQFETGAVP